MIHIPDLTRNIDVSVPINNIIQLCTYECIKFCFVCFILRLIRECTIRCLSLSALAALVRSSKYRYNDFLINTTKFIENELVEIEQPYRNGFFLFLSFPRFIYLQYIHRQRNMNLVEFALDKTGSNFNRYSRECFLL